MTEDQTTGQPSWSALRVRYEAGNEKVKDIAASAGVTGFALVRKARELGWRLRNRVVKSVAKATAAKQPTTRETLERLLGAMDDWGTFDLWLERYLATPELRRSVRASSFTASLELVREGVLELRQDDVFKPIYVRRRPAAA